MVRALIRKWIKRPASAASPMTTRTKTHLKMVLHFEKYLIGMFPPTRVPIAFRKVPLRLRASCRIHPVMWGGREPLNEATILPDLNSSRAFAVVAKRDKHKGKA